MDTFGGIAPFTISPGQWTGKGGDLTNQKFKSPIVWESQVIKSPSYAYIVPGRNKVGI